MSDEQKEILNMLAEKIINPDEAERLLNALNKKQKLHHRHRGRGHSFSKRAMHEAASSVNETFSNIGPMLKEMADDITSSFRSEDFVSFSQHEADYDQIECENSEFTIEPGTTLEIVNGPAHNKTMNSNLTIVATDGSNCRFTADNPGGVRVLKSPTGPLIRWQTGSITVHVPTGYSGVNASTRGGDIEVENLDCWLNAKTMGGDIELTRMKNGYNAKTMGGNINLIIDANWEINSQVKTMGGDITISVPKETEAAEIRAVTMAGDIDIENCLDNVEKSSHGVNKKVRIRIGETPDKVHLNAKTMGGDIYVKRAHNE